MASKIIARAVAVIMVLELLTLLSSAKECGVMVSEDPLCFAANKDACDTWCYHKGYDSGACYAGPGAGDISCICYTPCPKGSLLSSSSAAEPATGRAA